MKTGSIVIADDDNDLLEMLRRRCEGLGLDVSVAGNAFDALRLVHDKHPDLVCLDQNMPCGSGLGVREMLSDDQRLSRLPVIILTGRTDAETVRRCHDSGAYYVLKGADTWGRVRPLIRELLTTPPTDRPWAVPLDRPEATVDDGSDGSASAGGSTGDHSGDSGAACEA